ncbi:hypothetical protein H5410_001744 [Solanum commersonii]|uniref:Uncharacterized protein n=1 Tax=Solanum commersonii TaxID=4109 RepID=A0A9J6B0G4_SOLCO|nr:hypothetical protein H5410_001744 [Solanum commersonii]
MLTHSLGYQSSGLEKSNGYKKLNLNISKGRRMEKTHFQFGEDELLFSQVSQNPFPNLKENMKAKCWQIARRGYSRTPNDSAIHPSSSSSPFLFCLQHLCVLDLWAVYFCFAELISEVLTAFFIAFFILLLQGFAYWNKECSTSLRRITKHAWQCSGFSFFVLFIPFTQITHAKINCVHKDLSCDTPLPKILMLAILATCASSSSTETI